MAQHRSMRGQVLDMQALTAAHEDTIAVTGGGTTMNAKGDILGPGGKIVKKAEQIAEEYQTLNTPAQQKVSIADTNRMKKFALKRQFLTPEEIQNQINELEKEKTKAKKQAEKVLTSTDMLAAEGPIIKENPEKVKSAKRIVQELKL
mgnify:CR=1 FL=1